MSTPVEIAVKAVGTAAAGRAISGVDGKTSKLGGTLRKVAAAGALAFGAAAVFGAKKLVDFTQAAIEDEAAQSALAQTLKKTTGATDKQVASVEKWITKQGRLLGVTDDELRPALQRMAEGTGSVAKAQRMVSLAMDVSAGTGKSLKAVTEALLRAQNGSVGGLSRYGIATKDAAGETLSLNKVLDGMRDKFGGQAAKHADTMAGKMERLKLVMSEAGESIGAKFLPLLSDLVPALTDTAITVTNKVVPAVGDMVDWLTRNKDQIRDTVGAVKDGLLPPLKTLGGVVADVARFFGGLPQPVQSFGAQAAAAALILPRLSSALTVAKTNMIGLSATAGTASTRMAALKRTAGLAAGVGGVLALSAAAKETNKPLKATETILGGVAIGFAMGGPVGAFVGLLGGVGKATLDATDPAEELAAANRLLGRTYSGVKSKAEGYAGTLNQVTGAISKQTKVAALHAAQDQDILPLMGKLDVSQRDLIGTILGNAGATRRLTAATAKHRGELTALEELRLNEFLGVQTRGFAQQQHQVIENNRAVTSWKQALKGLPPKVQTAVKQLGAEASAGEIRKLKKQYDLSPKKVQTIIDAIGTETTIRKVRGVWQVFEDGHKVRANLDPWQRDLASAMANGRRTADKGVRDVNGLLFSGTGKARANLGPFNSSITSGISSARAKASSGGSGVGGALVAGLVSGIGKNAWQAVSAAGQMVTDAIIEANNRADRHSPSKVTMALGADMAEGLARGMHAGNRRNRQAGRKAADSIIEGFDAGSGGVARVVGRLSDLIASTYAQRAKATRKRIDNAKAERQALHRLDVAENARTKSLKRLDNALVENGKRQDQNNAALENARGKLKEILETSREYASSIREAVTATGDVTTLGKDEAGTATAAGIIDQMTARVQAAKRYADLIAKLTKAGLNKTSLQQILAAGVEGGLSTAEALAAGGSATIKQVNTLTAQLVASGTGLGDSAADTMYGAGIKAAEGLVKGLEAKEKRIDAVAKRLATTLANAVRRALKVHSPSRVFEDIGKRTVEGLQVGLDDTHVRRSGRKLAASLVDGFSDPKLTATAVLDATTGAGGGAPTVRVELTAAQVDALQRGRGIALDVDAFGAAGGRRVAKVVRR